MNLGVQSRVRKWEDVTVEKLYMVTVLFMMMEETPILQTYFSKNWLLENLFLSETIPLYRLEFICKLLHFTDNSKKDNFRVIMVL
jgi:hypothetical protein